MKTLTLLFSLFCVVGCEAAEEEAHLTRKRKRVDSGEIERTFYPTQELSLLETNPKEFFSLLERSSDQDDVHSLFILASYVSGGEHIPQDFERAAKLFKRAADLGCSNSQYKYAAHLYQGLGVEKDLTQALDYLEKSFSCDALYVQWQKKFLFAKIVLSSEEHSEKQGQAKAYLTEILSSRDVQGHACRERILKLLNTIKD